MISRRKKSGYEYVKKSLQFIDYNYSRSIDVDDIAANVGISRSHLYRLFMKHISVPPNEYLTRYRIQKASLLLESSNLSVGEAAYSTGFSDQLYFSRVFKKYKGLSPSQYSKRSHEKNEKTLTRPALFVCRLAQAENSRTIKALLLKKSALHSWRRFFLGRVQRVLRRALIRAPCAFMIGGGRAV